MSIGIVAVVAGLVIGTTLFCLGSKPGKSNLILPAILFQFSTVTSTFYYFGIWWGIGVILITVFISGFFGAVVSDL